MIHYSPVFHKTIDTLSVKNKFILFIVSEDNIYQR